MGSDPAAALELQLRVRRDFEAAFAAGLVGRSLLARRRPAGISSLPRLAMSIFEIDPDIRKARMLPAAFYTDPEFFEQSKERIFARTWQFVGKGDEVEVLKPLTILPGFLDEPVLIVKTSEWLSCLSNVCTRGKILVEEPCSANLIRCSYHGRSVPFGRQMHLNAGI